MPKKQSKQIHKKTSEILPNAPLVEVIFQIKWTLKPIAPGFFNDPYYKVMLGRFYDRIEGEYPFIEELPAASIPEEISGHTVQHRFRVGDGQHPLIQVGPGVMTVNDVQEHKDGHIYSWHNDFKSRILFAVEKLFDAYPKGLLQVESLTLRYVDAVDCNFSDYNLFDFLSKKMGISFKLPSLLFDDRTISEKTDRFVWDSSFHCNSPAGNITVKFMTGYRNGTDEMLLWETIVQSRSHEIPEMPARIDSWLTSAHEITGDWFLKLIKGGDGELYRRFKNG